MDAGKLDRKIEFWQLGMVANNYGTAKTETLLISTFAKVRSDNTLNRVVEVGAIDLQGMTEFVIYQRASFIPTKALIIRYKGVKYVIHSITDLKDQKDYWRIQARHED